MINPLKSIYLDNKWFNYKADSYRESIALQNSVATTQNSRTCSCQGGTLPAFTITVALDNTYHIRVGTSDVGSTTWIGVSRLDDLKRFAGAQGVSMPTVFVNPYGATYNVIPTGALDINIYNPSNPSSDSAEFRVTLTLEAI